MINDSDPTEWQYRCIHQNENRWLAAAGHIGFGLRSGIPLCCCMAFAWHRARTWNDEHYDDEPQNCLCRDIQHCALHRWWLHGPDMPEDQFYFWMHFWGED